MNKPIPGFENEYEATPEGHIWSVRGRIVLKERLHKKGYPTITLRDKTKSRSFFVHKLVAAAFLGPAPEGREVNHIDHVKTNNDPSNLEYVTRTENQHAYQKHVVPGWVPRGNLLGEHSRPRPMEAVAVVGGKVLRFATTAEALEMGFTDSGISLCLSGRLKSHRGYKFRSLA